MVKGKKVEKELIFEAMLFILAVALVALLYKNNVALTSAMIIGWLIAIKIWHKKEDIYLFVVAAVAGSIAEAVAIEFGAWHYTNPTLLGVPIWLPLLWGLAVVFIRRISDAILRFTDKK